MKAFKIDQNSANQRLDRYLSKLFERAAKGEIQRWIRTKKIKVNGKKSVPNTRVAVSDIVEVYLPETVIDNYLVDKRTIEPDAIGLDIVYEDDEILIVNKPMGLLTHPDKNEYKNTLATKVQYYLKEQSTATFRPASINRLDKNTSGLVLYCKTYERLKYYNQLMRERKIEKRYMAIVEGHLTKKQVIRGYLIKDSKINKTTLLKKPTIGAKAIVTKIDPLAFKDGYTKVDIDLKTGRTHQIRVSLASIGHPIIGDVKYGGKKLKGVTTQLLHAYYLMIDQRVFKRESQEIETFWRGL